MRYYAIQIYTLDRSEILITNPQTGQFEPSFPLAAGGPPTSLLPGASSRATANPGQLQSTWTSYVNGKTLPGALNVELNIPISSLALPISGGWLRIWGVPLAQIGFARDLTNLPITIYGGMQAGLPLANPLQNGIIATGRIAQAFANWQGTDMTLDFVFFPDGGTNDNPANLVLNWTKGMPLSQALASTLRTAFPNYKQNIVISPNLVLNYDEVHYVATLTQLAQWLKQRTQPIIGGTYKGVDLLLRDGMLTAFDGTQPFGQTTLQKPKVLEFQDLIGQPTWIDQSTIQITTVMRADLHVQDFIRLPRGIASPFSLVPTNTVALQHTPARNQTTFSGKYQIQTMWHYGNYRQADASSWVTTINAYFVNDTSPPGDFPGAFANIA